MIPFLQALAGFFLLWFPLSAIVPVAVLFVMIRHWRG